MQNSRSGSTNLTLCVAAALLFAATTLRAQHRDGTQPPTPYEIEGKRAAWFAGDPLDYSSQPFDVLHYEADLNLMDAPAKTMSGRCRITFRWVRNPAEGPFIFHLRLNDLVIDTAYYGSTIVSPTEVGDETLATYRFEILPPESAREGDTAVVTIVYRGSMTDEYGPGRWGGVSSGGGVLYAMGVGFSNNYVSATQHWMPCYDHPSDKATFTGRFTVPAGMVVASNGLLSNHTVSAESEIYEWNTAIPTATYLLTFAVSNYVEVNLGTPELPMVLYAQPQDSALTHQSFTLLPRMVAGFAQRFGPYPFEKVGYVNTPQGAMEHQTMVSFPRSLSRTGDSLNTTGAHELAHQWFGDLVTPLDFRHAWLNESFATFCESMWMEELGGFTAYLASQQGKLSDYIGQTAPQEGILPLYDFPRASPSSNYPATIYNKGAVVVGMLRYELGDEKFFAAMRAYLNRYAYGNAGTDSLLAVCEEISGKDLDLFFDQWVRRAGWPILHIDVTRKPGINEGNVHIRQVQLPQYGTFRDVPIEIGFLTPSGIEYKVLRLNEADQEFNVTLTEPFDGVLVNQGPTLRTLLEVRDLRTLGVDGSEQENREAVYSIVPNPLHNATSITISRKGDLAAKSATLRLYDSAGRRIRSEVVNRFPHIFTTDSISSGHYLLQIVEEGHNRIIPLLIER